MFNALCGAYRLARFDAGGIKYFDISQSGFWFSFKAAILVLPLYLAILIARWSNMETEISGFWFFIIEMIGYVIAWAAFPVILPYVLRYLDREKNYIQTIVAYNWAAVLQNLLYTPIAILNLSGMAGAGLLSFITLIAILAYSWFVIKTALDVPSPVAWLVVGIDIAISIFLSLWIDSLLST